MIAGQLAAMKIQGTMVRTRTPSVLGPYVSDWAIIAFGDRGLPTVDMKPQTLNDIVPVFWDDDYSPLLPILK